MAGGGEVAADLVGDAGIDDDVEEREGLAGLKGRPFGEGGELIAGGDFVGIAHDGHFARGAGLVGERVIEAARGIDDAVDEGGVVLPDGETAELLAEVGVCGGGLGGENEAGGLRVEAVEQGRKEAVAADGGQFWVAGNQGVGEGAGFREAQGMGGQAGGLVEGKEGVVFVEDVQGEIGIGLEPEVGGFGDVSAVEGVAGDGFGAFLGGAAVEEDVAGGDQVFDGASVEPGIGVQQEAVEAGAGAAEGVLFARDHGVSSRNRRVSRAARRPAAAVHAWREPMGGRRRPRM